MIKLTGDTHGEMEITKLKNAKPVSKEDVIIQLGDFGLIFSPIQTKTEKYWLDWIEDNFPCDVLFLDGNHDNHNLIWSYPTVEKYGNTVHQIRKNLFYLKRGNIYTIQGKTFFVMGGAKSIDKNSRTPDVNWWSTEEPTFMEWKHAFDNLKGVPYVDYILTHDTCDTGYDFLADLTGGNYEKGKYSVSAGLEEVRKQVQYKWWYLGHHHIDHTFPTIKTTIVYDKVITIE